MSEFDENSIDPDLVDQEGFNPEINPAAPEINVFDVFGGLFGDSNPENIAEAKHRKRFVAGLNENCYLKGIGYEEGDGWKAVVISLKNSDDFTQDFRLYVPELKEDRIVETDSVTYQSVEKIVKTWRPKRMIDAAGNFTNDPTRRVRGGVVVLDEKGRWAKDPISGKWVYRNETEEEAQLRQVSTFRFQIDCVFSAFAEKDATAWNLFGKQLAAKMQESAQAQGVTNVVAIPNRWEIYVTALMSFIENYTNSGESPAEYDQVPLKIKLYAKYDAAISARNPAIPIIPDDPEQSVWIARQTSGMLVITDRERQFNIEAEVKEKVGNHVSNTGGDSAIKGLPTAGAAVVGLNQPTITIATTPGIPGLNNEALK